MSTIQDLFQQAQLAEAAYANFAGMNTATLQSDLVGALTTGDGKFSTAQASAFATHWRVVDQYTASGLFGLTDSTGFSATVFESMDNPGQYSIAMRGTAGATDLMADAGDVLTDGLALDQIVDMYNYWQSLNHDLGYTAYKLETQLAETAYLTTLWAQVAIPGASIYAKGVYDAYRAELQTAGLIVDVGPLGPSVRKLISGDSVVLLTGTPLAVGSGKLIGVSTVDAGGHSLGGHLAMAFSRLFPTATGDVVAVNGAGFDLNNGNVNTLFSQLNGAAGFDAGKITNVVGSAAMNLVSQDWLFLQQPAGRSEIYTESYLPGSGTTLGHGSSQMTDSLAVYNLLATLDPSLNTNPAGLTKIGDILRASSNTAERSLETTLDALGKVFGQTFATATGDRESYYTNLNQVRALLGSALPASYTVASLANMDAATLVANASDPANTAYRYALKELNAFAVVGADYSSFNQNGELTLYNPATRTGTLTDQYLKDRSAFLVDKNLSNTQDNLSNGMGYVDYAGTKQYFRNEGGTTPTTVVLGGGLLANQLIAQPPDDIQQIRFGSDTVIDTLQGGSKADHLYGMGGDDTLQGNGGNDYLEGGQGADTYVWNTGDGLDTLLDTDGLGSIVINGQTLGLGETKDGGKTYTSKDAANISHTYTVLAGDINAAGGATLLVDNAFEIFNYRAGDLGLTPSTAPAEPVPPSTVILTGDLAPLLDANNNLQYDPVTGNVITDPNAPVAGRMDTLKGGAGDDVIEGRGGIDILSGGAGNDILYGGDRIAVAQAITNGDGDPNTNTQGDWLNGGSGSDILVGGAADDILMGGGGSDLIVGGAGNDHIMGDGDYATQAHVWSVAQTGPLTEQITAIGLDPSAYMTPDGASDVIYAGNGNDFVVGGLGNDIIFGGDGADTLWGDDANIPQGNDYLEGGLGNDNLIGGGGNDIYAYNLGDGSDKIYDRIVAGETNLLLFGAGIALDNLKLSARDTGYVLTLMDGSTLSLMSGASGYIDEFGGMVFDPQHTDIQQLQFADGSSIGWADFLKRGLDQHGQLPGTVLGSEYDDELSGANSTLAGGKGSDTYSYKVGDGKVHIRDFNIGGDVNILKLGPGISAEQIVLRKGLLMLDLGNGDEIHIDNFSADDALNSSTIQRFELDDGTVLTTAELLARRFDLDGTAGGEQMRWRSSVDNLYNATAANDEATQAWRVAA